MSYGAEYLADHAYEMEYHECCCGDCKFNRYDWTNPKNKSFYCGNERSEYYGDNTEYRTTCSEWKGKNN